MSSKIKLVKKSASQGKSEPSGMKSGETNFLKEFRNKKVTKIPIHSLNGSNTAAATSSKITHPFAKYNTLGQLHCVICSLNIPNDKSWPVHVQSRKHRDTMDNMKRAASKSSQKESNSILSKREKKDESIMNPPKKLKSILKSSLITPDPEKESDSVDQQITSPKHTVQSNNLPSDFFDATSPSLKPPTSDTPVHEDSSTSTEHVAETNKGEGDSKLSEVLPEGFFDDPKRDAKVRGVKQEETMEKEWESFQKLLETDNEKSELIVTQQDQIVQLERDFTETHQQNIFYNRAEELRKRQETIITSDKKVTKYVTSVENEADVSDRDSNSEFELELDWRAQT